MLYHVARNGQMYGPYTLEDLQRYVTSGNILPTDLARAEGSEEWVPVAQLLGIPPAQAGPGYTVPPGFQSGYSPAYPSAYGQPLPATDPNIYPDPPNLPWGLVLLLGMLTCGLFMVVWDIVIAVWVRRIQPASQALLYFIAGAVLRFINSGVTFGVFYAMQRHHAFHNHPASSIIGLIGWVLVLVALFNMKATLEQHFNGPEPIGLRLSGGMVFFFGGVYFQYHLNRITEIKAAMRYRGVPR